MKPIRKLFKGIRNVNAQTAIEISIFGAVLVFGAALVLLISSLGLSINEILISVKALDIHLSDMEQD